jgi:phage I-like protein
MLELAAGAVLPEWIRVLPLGAVELADEREPFTVDEESLAGMVTGFRGRGVDLVIDYEHQSLKGERAPAAGWIKELEARDDGLYARVEWTAQAEEYLKAREYRYFSPVLRLDAKSRKPLALLHVGLTNVPAIKGLKPLVARCGGQGPDEDRCGEALRRYEALQRSLEAAREKEEQAAMQETWAKRLGLEDGAGTEEVWARLEDLWTELTGILGLAAEAPATALVEAVRALKGGVAEQEEVQEELARLKMRVAEAEVSRKVDEALAAGKISPAQRAWAVEYCRQDMEQFEAFVAGAAKVVPVGEELPRFRMAGSEGPRLTPQELAICRGMNIAPECFQEAKAEQERSRP